MPWSSAACQHNAVSMARRLRHNHYFRTIPQDAPVILQSARNILLLTTWYGHVSYQTVNSASLFHYFNSRVSQTAFSPCFHSILCWIIPKWSFIFRTWATFRLMSLPWNKTKQTVFIYSTQLLPMQTCQNMAGENKENIKAPHYWPFVRAIYCWRWIPLTKGQ